MLPLYVIKPERIICDCLSIIRNCLFFLSFFGFFRKMFRIFIKIILDYLKSWIICIVWNYCRLLQIICSLFVLDYLWIIETWIIWDYLILDYLRIIWNRDFLILFVFGLFEIICFGLFEIILNDLWIICLWIICRLFETGIIWDYLFSDYVIWRMDYWLIIAWLFVVYLFGLFQSIRRMDYLGLFVPRSQAASRCAAHWPAHLPVNRRAQQRLWPFRRTAGYARAYPSKLNRDSLATQRLAVSECP